MKLILLLVTLGLVTILADNNPELLKTFSDRYHNFTSNIYNTAISKSGTNYAIYPTALNLILAIIYAGAKGSSAKNIANLLQIPQSSEVIHQTFSDLARKLNRDAYLNFGSINKIYIQDGFHISNTYNKTIVDIFKGNIDNIDFKEYKKAEKIVSSWVYEKSSHLVSLVLTWHKLNKRSTMLLISTMNFHGLFTKNLFKEETTVKRDFYIQRIISVKTDMMEAFCNCSYYESKDLDARFLKLIFTNIPDGSITFVLPNDKEGLKDLKAKIDQVLLKPNYSNEFVRIFIPRFKIRPTTFGYSEFVDAGIKDDFENEANLTLIGANQEPLKIDYIIQEVIVEVNEIGSESKSATYAMLKSIPPYKEYRPMGGSSGLDFDDDYVQPAPKIFQAHHPFIYYITIKDVNVVVGDFSDPTEQYEDPEVLVQSRKKTKKAKKLGKEIQPTEAPMTNIVDEHTCPCNFN